MIFSKEVPLGANSVFCTFRLLKFSLGILTLPSVLAAKLFLPLVITTGHSSSDNPLITHAEAAKLLNSLLKLRQACCHPQVGSSGLRSLQQTPMTMEEILMVSLQDLVF